MTTKIKVKTSETDDEVKTLLIKLLSEISEMKEDIADIKLGLEKDYVISRPHIVLKKERLEIDDNDVINCLKLNSIKVDILLIKQYYFKHNVQSPIKYVNMRKYEYWDGKKWTLDLYGVTIMEIIICNLKHLYIRINTVENYDSATFLSNQEYINKMNNDRYRKNLQRLMIRIFN